MKLNKKRLEKFEQYLKEMMVKYKIPGVSVAIAHKEELLYAKCFGYRNQEKQELMDPDTILGVASISKSFAALAVAKLVEEKKMNYDDSLTKYFPNFKLPGEYNPSDIKIRHLLSHTAGFPPLTALNRSIIANTISDEGEDKESFSDDIPVNTIEELIDFMSSDDYEMLGKPQEYLSYSNDCYALLGGIIEQVSGLTFDKYIKDNVFKPLDMKRSFFQAQKLTSLENVTTLYYEKDDKIKASDNWQEAPPYLACGWVRSSANDLIKYAQMYANKGEIFGKTIIKPESIEKMISDKAAFSSYSDYGYGLMINKDYQGLSLVEHGGSLKGVSSNFGFVIEAELAVVVLSNLAGIASDNIWLAAVNTALGLPLARLRKEYQEFEWEQEDFLIFNGKYSSDEGANIEIEVKALEITMKMEKQEYQLKIVGDLLGIINIKDRVREVKFIKKDGKAYAISYGGRIIRKVKE